MDITIQKLVTARKTYYLNVAKDNYKRDASNIYPGGSIASL